MKVDNALPEIDNRSCGLRADPLFARGAAGWRRGYAADCESVGLKPEFPRKSKRVAPFLSFDKTARQSANTSETLTPGWWIAAATILGAAIWALLIVEVMG